MDDQVPLSHLIVLGKKLRLLLLCIASNRLQSVHRYVRSYDKESKKKVPTERCTLKCMQFPRRMSPTGEISVAQTTLHQLLTKAGIIWTPIKLLSLHVCKYISKARVQAEGKSVSRSTTSAMLEFESPFNFWM